MTDRVSSLRSAEERAGGVLLKSLLPGSFRAKTMLFLCIFKTSSYTVDFEWLEKMEHSYQRSHSTTLTIVTGLLQSAQLSMRNGAQESRCGSKVRYVCLPWSSTAFLRMRPR